MSLTRSTLIVAASRVLVLFAGLAISIVAAHSLSAVEQGFFFTFLSLAAAQTLFELGITNLILHHLSHARAGILVAVNEQQRQAAIEIAKATSSYSTRYFRSAAFLFLVLVGIAGGAFFARSEHSAELSWRGPWLLMLVATSLGLFNLSSYSHLEGFGQLHVAYRVRIASTLLLITAFCVFAALFGGLASYPAALLLSNGYAFWTLRLARAEVDREHGLEGPPSSMRIDIGPEQRKMAISAVAGYITANSLTPYAFHFFGAEAAGQVGLTMSIFGAIATVAMARTTAEAPTYGPLIAEKAKSTLQDRIRLTLLYSGGLMLLLCSAAIAVRQIGLALFPQYAPRVLDTGGFVVLGLLFVANVIVSVTGTALRAFRTEMLMWPSLLGALAVLAGQLIFRLSPVHCIAVLATFNGLVFFPYAQHLLSAKIAEIKE